MSKLWVVFVLFLIVPLAMAQNEVTIKIDTIKHTDFSNHLLTIKIDDKLQKTILQSNEYKTTLLKGEHEVEIIIDNVKTPTPDYFGSKKLDYQGLKSYSILVSPIGYLEGTVIDLKGNLVPNADIKFSCYTSEESSFLKKTDRTGFFTIPNIPVSECMATAYDGDYAGRKKFMSKKGQPTSIQITLDKKIEKTNYWLILVVVGVIVIFGALFLVMKKRNKEYENNKNQNKIKEAVSKENQLKRNNDKTNHNYPNNTTETILKTLSEKEKKVMQYLIDNKNKSSQAKIRHATHLPRTSLSRVLKKLEGKKLISIEKHGKMVEVTLTDFFLGKN